MDKRYFADQVVRFASEACRVLLAATKGHCSSGSGELCQICSCARGQLGVAARITNSRKDAAWRLACIRMPYVIEHLRVVLRTKEPLQEDEVQAELAALTGQPAAVDYANIYKHPLEVGPFEVVAIYALLPPEPPAKEEPVKSVMLQWAESVLSVLYRRPRQVVATVMTRLAAFLWTSHYGLSALIKLNSWLDNYYVAEKVAELSDLYDRSMHHLQTMCVAANQQRKGLGTSALQLAKLEVQREQGSGILGFCQSEETRKFYEKQGFASRDVFTHPPSELLSPKIRKHYFLAWDARRDDQDTGEVAML